MYINNNHYRIKYSKKKNRKNYKKEKGIEIKL